MFKKFNWGHGIFVFYVVFVGAVVTALVASFGVDHSLVVDDYYAQDLAYQSQYDKTSNALRSNAVAVDNDKQKQALTINFEETQKVNGFVNFYRPSDKSEDFKVKLDDNATTIPTDKLLPST